MKNSKNWIHFLPCLLAAGVLTLFSACSHQNQYESLQDAKQGFVGLIEAAGGSAEVKRIREFDDVLEGESWFIDLSGSDVSSRLGKAILEQAARPPGTIASLNLSKSTITNEQLLEFDTAMVCSFTLFLDLSDTGLDDATLGKFKNLYCLKTLNLMGTKVTAAAVKSFKDNRRSNREIKPQFKDPKIQM